MIESLAAFLHRIPFLFLAIFFASIFVAGTIVTTVPPALGIVVAIVHAMRATA